MDMQEINVKLIAINNALPESVNLSSAKDLMSLIQANGICLRKLPRYKDPEIWEAISGDHTYVSAWNFLGRDSSPTHALFKVLYELAVSGKLIPSKG